MLIGCIYCTYGSNVHRKSSWPPSTLRLIIPLQGEIGVLDRTEMEHFAGIFIAYQRMGKTSDPRGRPLTLCPHFRRVNIVVEIEQLKAKLAPWTHHDSPGKARADFDSDSFSVQYAFTSLASSLSNFVLPS